MGFIAAAASAQTSRYEELAKLPFEQGFPNKQTSLALTDELVFQRAVQAYLWALPTNRHHFFEPNEIKRYSTGTKNKEYSTEIRLRRLADSLRTSRSAGSRDARQLAADA